MKKKCLIHACIISSLIGCWLLSFLHPVKADLTLNQHNSLSETSRKVVAQIQYPMKIYFHTADVALAEALSHQLVKFEDSNRLITWQQIADPSDPLIHTHMQRLQSTHILLIQYQQYNQAQPLTSQSLHEAMLSKLIANAIQQETNWLTFLIGHGEASIFDNSANGLSHFAQLLQQQGLSLAEINLLEQGNIPDNSKLLVIAGMQSQFYPEERQEIKRYIQRGGQILWAMRPQLTNIDFLRAEFGMELYPGIVSNTEPNQALMSYPSLVVLSDFPEHEINQTKETIVLPWVVGLSESKAKQPEGMSWQKRPLLAVPQAKIHLDNQSTINEANLAVAYAFSRTTDDAATNQRMVLIGSTDLFTNRAIHHYGNSKLVGNIVDWLNDSLSDPAVTSTEAKSYMLPDQFSWFMLRYVFPVGMPLVYLAFGFLVIWLRPRWRNY